jgi:hypothetical protein
LSAPLAPSKQITVMFPENRSACLQSLFDWRGQTKVL